MIYQAKNEIFCNILPLLLFMQVEDCVPLFLTYPSRKKGPFLMEGGDLKDGKTSLGQNKFCLTGIDICKIYCLVESIQ